MGLLPENGPSARLRSLRVARLHAGALEGGNDRASAVQRLRFVIGRATNHGSATPPRPARVAAASVGTRRLRSADRGLGPAGSGFGQVSVFDSRIKPIEGSGDRVDPSLERTPPRAYVSASRAVKSSAAELMQ